MEITENLGLKKPDEDEAYDITKFNENMDIIDAKVQECFQSVSDGKALVASAITDKGVDTDSDATFSAMAENIESIQTNPTLQSKTTVLSTSNQVIKADAGYDGLSQVTVPAVTGTANVEDVVAGKTFGSASGVNQTGTLLDKTDTTEYTAAATLDSTNSELKMTIPATGKYNTNNKLKATFAKIGSLIGLTSAKLVKGNTILGITGNSNNMDTSGGDATVTQILSGKKACVDGELRTGTMANKSSTTVTASSVTQDDDYTYLGIPAAGYYDTNSKVRTENSNLKIGEIVSRVNSSTINSGSSVTNFFTVYTKNAKKIIFDAYGYGNYRDKVITLGIYGANDFDDSISYGYNNPCTDGVLIENIAYTQGQHIEIDVTGYKYIYFNASNNNDAYAGCELRHVVLS